MRKSTKKTQTVVAVIGARAYPAEFIGTSGIEFYIQQVAEECKVYPIKFDIYTKKCYQHVLPKKKHKLDSTRVITVPTTRGKVGETVIYSFFTSILASFSSAKVVWYNGIGTGIFAWIPLLFGKKVVLTLHGLDWKRKKWSTVESDLFSLLSQFIFCLPLHFFSVSSKQVPKELDKRDVTIAEPGFIYLKKSTDGTAILKDLNLAKRNYFLYVGRIVAEKRIEWLCDAFLSLNIFFKKQTLVIAGSPSTTTDYYERLRKKYERNNILFIGPVFGNRKAVLLAHARACVLPSKLEGFPVTLMETVPLRTPFVIARNFIPADLQKISGIKTFQADSYVSFFIQILLLSIKSTAGTLSTEVRKKYHWKRTAQKYAEVFLK